MDLRGQTPIGGLDGARTFEPQEVLGAHHVVPFDVRWQTFAVNIADPTEVSAGGRGSRQGAGSSPRAPDLRSSDPVVFGHRPSTVLITERLRMGVDQGPQLGLGLIGSSCGDSPVMQRALCSAMSARSA